LLLLRNAVVVGVFLGVKNNQILYVHLDFVTAQYRDLKPGDFIYQKNIKLMKDQGIQQIICNTEMQPIKNIFKNGIQIENGKTQTVFIKNI